MSDDVPAGAPPPDAARVSLRRLKLQDFRNYASLDLALDGRSVVFTGENGAGKTNLLEAVSLLAPGRGLRRAAYDEIARDGGSGGFAVHAALDGTLGPVEIGTGTAGSIAPDGGRKVRINGAPARSAEAMLEWLRVVWLTPAMDALFTGPAGDRRRFLDRLVLAIDPRHGQRALDFEKAMRGRNRLLAEDSRDSAWLTAIEAQMAETGVAIAAARFELVRLITGIEAPVSSETAAFPGAGIALSGHLEERLARAAATDVEEAYREALRDGRGRDRAAGRTLDGPHRSDLLVTHLPKAMPAGLCSTGEQKALLVGLVLDHARLAAGISGLIPIVLLDEIAAHLDLRRRDALFALLADLGCQAIMTGTDRSLFAGLAGRAEFLAVAEGHVAASSA
ncbi:MAG: DNA replication/repair protein RecF [Rhizobiaceae bacterium]|nr:DNA replication/repair protein RecF [Rhizobiaceae bacterium]